jgi:hypothetical protein
MVSYNLPYNPTNSLRYYIGKLKLRRRRMSRYGAIKIGVVSLLVIIVASMAWAAAPIKTRDFYYKFIGVGGGTYQQGQSAATAVVLDAKSYAGASLIKAANNGVSITAPTTITGTVGITGKVTYQGEVVHVAQKTQTKADNYTMTLADSGMVTYVTADAKVITLPATTASATFIIRNGGATDGAVAVNISPAADDKIQGCGLTAADGKDLINTKATAKVGDSITLVGDGTDGWIIQDMTGTWAIETP